LLWWGIMTYSPSKAYYTGNSPQDTGYRTLTLLKARGFGEFLPEDKDA